MQDLSKSRLLILAMSSLGLAAVRGNPRQAVRNACREECAECGGRIPPGREGRRCKPCRERGGDS